MENFLSAHADGELSPAEKRQAEEHLATCGNCNARFTEELALKELLRTHLRNVREPGELRATLREALDAETAAKGSAGPTRSGFRPRREYWSAFRPRREYWSDSAALAAFAAMVFIVVGTVFMLTRGANTPLRPGTETMRDPGFDLAVAAFDRFDRHFEPNVPSNSPAEVSAAYAAAQMPESLWNFAGSGFTLAGGRIEKLPDGRIVTYTLYWGENGSILCTRFSVPNARLPEGAARMMDGHAFYRYRGYSVCLTRMRGGRVACILVSRLPVDGLIRQVETALK